MFPGGGQPFSLLIMLLVVSAAGLLRNQRPRRLRIGLLWIRPALFVVLTGALLFGPPPPLTPISMGLLACGLAIGCALGWQRGRLMRIEVDPETHALSARASRLGLLFIIALVAVRHELDILMRQNALLLRLPHLAVTDAFVLLAGGIMSAQGLEMWLRARRLLAAAMAAKAAST
jgi:hypothetical protein